MLESNTTRTPILGHFPSFSSLQLACAVQSALRDVVGGMPQTMIVWTYEGGEDGSEAAKRRGEQRSYAGDQVVDDIFGQGTLVRMDGGAIEIEFGHAEKEIKTRTKASLTRAHRTPRPTCSSSGRL